MDKQVLIGGDAHPVGVWQINEPLNCERLFVKFGGKAERESWEILGRNEQVECQQKN